MEIELGGARMSAPQDRRYLIVYLDYSKFRYGTYELETGLTLDEALARRGELLGDDPPTPHIVVGVEMTEHTVNEDG